MPRSCHPEGGDETAESQAPPALDPERVVAECEMEFVRVGGPGGQHRNRRETGVRLTHRPTGVVAMATERRSQSQNRALAVERMLEKLAARNRRKKPRKATRKSRSMRAREVEAKRKDSARKSARRSRPEE